MRDTVAKAYPKFPSHQPTLLLLVDDFKVSLSDDLIDMWNALYKPNVGCFAASEYCNLGAVAVMDMEKIDPSFSVYLNSGALEAVALPKDVFAKYQQIVG